MRINLGAEKKIQELELKTDKVVNFSKSQLKEKKNQNAFFFYGKNGANLP